MVRTQVEHWEEDITILPLTELSQLTRNSHYCPPFLHSPPVQLSEREDIIAVGSGGGGGQVIPVMAGL